MLCVGVCLNLQVGYGNGISYYLHAWSGTDNILFIYGHSNVGVQGRWVYRVDGNRIGATIMNIYDTHEHGKCGLEL